MARGTQHIRKRKVADAPRVGKRTRRKANTQESVLFFERLRGGAKWVFVFLALVFGLGFVLFGVGSGSSGIGDILQNQFNLGGGGSKSVGDLRKETVKRPNDPQAWRDLATRLTTDQKIDDAIPAWERYTALRPKDQGGLQQLASLLTQRAQELQYEAQIASFESQSASGALFLPPSTTPLGRAYADPSALQNPVGAAVATLANQKATDAYSKLTDVQTKALDAYRQLVKLAPRDPTLRIQLADAALSTNDRATAIAAYKKFLQLAPEDPLAPAVKRQLKQLNAPSASASATG